MDHLHLGTPGWPYNQQGYRSVDGVHSVSESFSSQPQVLPLENVAPTIKHPLSKHLCDGRRFSRKPLSAETVKHLDFMRGYYGIGAESFLMKSLAHCNTLIKKLQTRLNSDDPRPIPAYNQVTRYLVEQLGLPEKFVLKIFNFKTRTYGGRGVVQPENAGFSLQPSQEVNLHPQYFNKDELDPALTKLIMSLMDECGYDTKTFLTLSSLECNDAIDIVTHNTIQDPDERRPRYREVTRFLVDDFFIPETIVKRIISARKNRHRHANSQKNIVESSDVDASNMQAAEIDPSSVNDAIDIGYYGSQMTGSSRSPSYEQDEQEYVHPPQVELHSQTYTNVEPIVMDPRTRLQTYTSIHPGQTLQGKYDSTTPGPNLTSRNKGKGSRHRESSSSQQSPQERFASWDANSFYDDQRQPKYRSVEEILQDSRSHPPPPYRYSTHPEEWP